MWSGTKRSVASMIIGGVVCTALSMAGGFVTDLKIGKQINGDRLCSDFSLYFRCCNSFNGYYSSDA